MILLLCPKCGKPFKRIIKFNSNYDIYIHKQKAGSDWLLHLIEYCIVTKDYVYNHSEPDIIESPLNPGYRQK
jgi:hypothetical protein